MKTFIRMLEEDYNQMTSLDVYAFITALAIVGLVLVVLYLTDSSKDL